MSAETKQSNQINLESIVLIKSIFTRDLVLIADDRSKIVQDVDFTISNSDLTKDKFAIYLNVVFTIKYEGQTIVDLQVSYAGSFDKNNAAIDAKSLDTFAEINAPAIIFPFVREEVAMITSKAGIGTVLLQPVNFVELSKKKREAKQ